MGYPQDWDTLDKVSLKTPDFRKDSEKLQGRLTITFSQKDGFSIVAHKYGATIKPSADDKYWVVAEENPANADHYKVGDTYKTTEQAVNEGKALNLSFVDEECTQTRWLFELKNAYAVVTLPELCPVSSEPISPANRAAYSKLVADFLDTVTIY